MIFSYHKTARKLFLTSIPQDILITIPGTNHLQKINQAYTYGSIPLTIQTINQNFDLTIEKYISINFKALEILIDGIGGIEIDIQGDELNELNAILKKQDDAIIPASGPQILNGSRAIAYTKIQQDPGDYFQKINRQQKVIALVGKKVKSFNKLRLINLINDFLPYLETNLSIPEIISLTSQLVFGNNEKLIRLQLPDTDSTEIKDNYLIPKNLKDNIIQWHNRIYDFSNYQPSSTSEGINQKLIK